MRKSTKKLALILTVALMLGSMAGCGKSDKKDDDTNKTEAGGASGNENGGSDEQLPAEPERKVEAGDYVLYGTYEQDNDASQTEDIVWKVAEVNGDTAILVCDNILASSVYGEKPDSDYISWEKSYVRSFLNGEFYDNAFSDEEKANMKKQTTVSTCADSINKEDDKDNWYTMETEDMVNVLNYTQLDDYFPDAFDALALATPYAISQGAVSNEFWLVDVRSSSKTHIYYAYLTTKLRGNYDRPCGIRPVICVDSTAAGKKIVTDAVKTEHEEYIASTHPAFVYGYRWLMHQDFSTGQRPDATYDGPVMIDDEYSVTFPFTKETINEFHTFKLDYNDIDKDSALASTVPAGEEVTLEMRYRENAGYSGIGYNLSVCNYSDEAMTFSDCMDKGWFYVCVDNVNGSSNEWQVRAFLGFDETAISDKSWYDVYLYYPRQVFLEYMLETFGNPSYVHYFMSVDGTLQTFEEESILVGDSRVAEYFRCACDPTLMGEAYYLGWETKDYVLLASVSDSYYGEKGMLFIQSTYYMPKEMFQKMVETEAHYLGANHLEEIFVNYMNYVQ